MARTDIHDPHSQHEHSQHGATSNRAQRAAHVAHVARAIQHDVDAILDDDPDDVTPEQRANVELGTRVHLDDDGVLHVHVGEHDGPVRLVLNDEHDLDVELVHRTSSLDVEHTAQGWVAR